MRTVSLTIPNVACHACVLSLSWLAVCAPYRVYILFCLGSAFAIAFVLAFFVLLHVLLLVSLNHSSCCYLRRSTDLKVGSDAYGSYTLLLEKLLRALGESRSFELLDTLIPALREEVR